MGSNSTLSLRPHVFGQQLLRRSHARRRGKSHLHPSAGAALGTPLLARPVGDSRRSLDLCRPAAISGAFEAISRLTRATRRSLSFACAAVAGRIRDAEVTKSN